jgi:hypothetical protein
MIAPFILAAVMDVPVQVPAAAPQIGPGGCQKLLDDIGDKVKWCPQSQPAVTAVPLREIARRFAPILWFSPNEPLLWAKPEDIVSGWAQAEQDGQKRSCDLKNVGGLERIGIPHRLRHDDGKGPAVYYQLIEYDGRDPFDPRNETVNLTSVTRIGLRYFFYYLCDIGTNAHADDLEALQFTLKVRNVGNECRRLDVAEITGFAHGLEWVYNRLEVEATRRHEQADTPRVQKAGDLLLPVTVLVEEGKHASSPDRNGDGGFSPGYDVNKNVQEAWGIRDDFGSGLIVPKYHAEDTKQRHPGYRVFPADIAADDSLRKYYCGCSSPPQDWPRPQDEAPSYFDLAGVRPCPNSSGEPPTYQLESAYAKRKPESTKQLGDGDFGELPKRHTWLGEKLHMLSQRWSLNLRWDQPVDPVFGDRKHFARWPNQLALTVGGVRPWLPFWLAVRGTVSSERRFQRVDVLLLPSAARWIDSYLSLWGYSRGENGQLLSEAGYRIRLVSKEPPFKFPAWLARRVPLLGLRIGLRLPSLPHILGIDSPHQDNARAVRLVFELGGGAF